MTLLVDECVHASLVSVCLQAGCEIIHVSNVARGIAGEEVIRISNENGWIVLTEDKDYGELVFKERKKPAGVVYLRYSPKELENISIKLYNLLASSQLKFQGNFITVTAGGPRVKSFET
jgi:predicted nuclease of predicted toxin-antitoxin system